MELRQLEHFVAVAEERHFTRAARRVHLVQSSLSSSIQAMERELGSSLLTRGGRKVELTEAGRALLPAARRALAARDEAREAVDAVRGLLRGTLNIGMIQSFSAFDLPKVLAEYRARYPEVDLRLRNDGVPNLVSSVLEGRLELAFVDRPVDADRVREFPLGRESIVLAVSRDDPLAARDRVALTELADRDFLEFRSDSALRVKLDASCAAAGLRRRMRAEVDTMPYLVELVGHGAGVALLPRYTLHNKLDRVAAVAIEPEIPRETLAVTALDREPSPAASALLELLPIESPA